MRAAVATSYNAPLEIREVADPTPGPDHVLVRIEAAGVCATDLKVIEGGMGADPNAFPRIPGHEIAGRVESLGANVNGLSVGDPVAVHALFACGQCDFCQAGEDEACPTCIPNLAGVGIDGGYAELMSVPASRVLPLPPGMSAAEAAPLLCAGLTVYSALKNANLQPGQRVAILGIGGLGHLAIPIAKAMGAVPIAVTGSPDKAETARSLGAAEVVSAAEAAPALQTMGGAHVILNTADAAEPLTATMMGLRPQGTIALVTTSVGDLLPIPSGLVMGFQMRIIGSFFGSAQDLRELLALAHEHKIAPVIEQYPMAEVNAVHDRLRANQVRYRAVLTP